MSRKDQFEDTNIARRHVVTCRDWLKLFTLRVTISSRFPIGCFSQLLKLLVINVLMLQCDSFIGAVTFIYTKNKVWWSDYKERKGCLRGVCGVSAGTFAGGVLLLGAVGVSSVPLSLLSLSDSDSELLSESLDTALPRSSHSLWQSQTMWSVRSDTAWSDTPDFFNQVMGLVQKKHTAKKISVRLNCSSLSSVFTQRLKKRFTPKTYRKVGETHAGCWWTGDGGAFGGDSLCSVARKRDRVTGE